MQGPMNINVIINISEKLSISYLNPISIIYDNYYLHTTSFPSPSFSSAMGIKFYLSPFVTLLVHKPNSIHKTKHLTINLTFMDPCIMIRFLQKDQQDATV